MGSLLIDLGGGSACKARSLVIGEMDLTLTGASSLDPRARFLLRLAGAILTILIPFKYRGDYGIGLTM